MKCEQCLPAIETGNVWQRWQARRHAAGCPACAESLAAVAAWKQSLAAQEPLAPQHRAGWMAAATAHPAGHPQRYIITYTAIGTAAAAFVACVAWLLREPGEQPPIALTPQAVPALKTVPLEIRENPDVQQGLQQLSNQLEELSREAALLDERHEIRDLMDQSP